ncbi:MAG TPA: S-methyl-5-thioribose-1-phosphate isomerase [Desulfohalobiaceae bacterium]|nr:S-methyl-5-thioribose-1-phosphate isomerase [Desulfohalobiaceae bacterium]
MKRHIKYSESEQVLLLLDQRYLPHQEKWYVCRRVADVVKALQKMVVRGAPAIGVTAAYGCCLAAASVDAQDPEWQKSLNEKLSRLAKARPTAINLRYAVEWMRKIWKADPDIRLVDLKWLWLKSAKDFQSEDILANKALGRNGAELFQDGQTVMTHCNAGALATGGFGTALGVIRFAKTEGKEISVIANETRPFMQGARLTAYELQQDNIPVRVACDNAAGLLMSQGLVDSVLVGADRIAANGDTVNKIGTSILAVLANTYSIPFYVAAPLSTFDFTTNSGEDIPIEERPEHEVTHLQGLALVPEDIKVYNFAFDLTPAKLINCIITNKGLVWPPFDESIPKLSTGN